MILKKLLIPALLAGFSISAQAQLPSIGGGQIHGNFQIDAQYYNPDSAIGAPPVPEKALANGWGALTYTNGHFSAGLRYESYQNVLQGFDTRYKGTGIPYRFFTYTNEKLEVTVGNSYDQFGSGLVFRSYEDRGLGFDNSIDGLRVRYSPYKGIYLKGIWGHQRTFFTYSAGIVRGFDGEVNLNELFAGKMDSCKTQFIIGGSFVSKYQQDQDPLLVLPLNVGASAGRISIIRGRVNFSAEYAHKINDPTLANGYVYKEGSALLVSATYSRKGLGISLAAKRIDNFGFRSERNATGNAALINYLPALTKQHTYMLAAYYPYATQPNGEIGWQAEVAYKVKRGTKLGGKYGMDVTFNYSAAWMPDTTNLNDLAGPRKGYTSSWTSISDSLFFQDINIEIYKKFSPKVKATFLYAYIGYNKNVIEGKINYPLIVSHIGVIDVIWKVNDKFTLRSDLEHLYTKEDKGSWAAIIEEFTFGEHFFCAFTDQYNYGDKYSEPQHYLSVQGGYIRGTNRITLGYGKQRAGIFCVGGVCRFVPASNGFSLNITSSF
ncbi:MAG: DUF6029 family protein [Bacteroidia bacterium]